MASFFATASQVTGKIFRQVSEKGLWFFLRKSAWQVRTAWRKRWYKLQDRFGWFTYADWLRQNEPVRLTASLPQRAAKFAVIVWLDDAANGLAATLNSLQAQTYPAWEAWLVAPGGRVDFPPGIDTARLHVLAANPTAPAEELLTQVQAEWVGALHSGDLLSPAALALYVSAAENGAEVIYNDLDCLGADGRTRHSPLFLPDWSPELLCSLDYLRRAFIRRTKLSAVAEPGLDWPSVMTNAALAGNNIVHLPFVLTHTAAGYPPASMKPVKQPPVLPAVDLNSDEPLVSIVILSSDRVDYLRRCLQSLFSQTSQPAYEVILVENNSRLPETLEYYETLRHNPQVRIIEHHHPFNYAAFNNLGAAQANGRLLLFLNNDTEIVEPKWLLEMARWALQSEIGAVGAKLLYPSGLIQHAGVVIGLEGHAHHIFSGQPEDGFGIWGSPNWYRNASAVTGACLMIRRDVFEEIDGFDEHYQIAFNDVELCLRVGRAGYRVVYTPQAKLIHHEGASRASHIPAGDIRYSRGHFEYYMQTGDPFYNPNLSTAVHWPTFRRRGEESQHARFEHILEYLG